VPPESIFNSSLGDLPFVAPNVSARDEAGDILKKLNAAFGSGDCGNTCMSVGCGLSVIGLCWIYCKMLLINEGQWGFVMHSGVPEMLGPGRYFLSSPLTEVTCVVDQGEEVIRAPPITLIRVTEGKLGIGSDNGKPEILLPGRHLRFSSNFKLIGIRDIQEELIEYGPIKILTVRSGGVRICYESGKVQIFPAGRYGINSATFSVAGLINTQQQNVKCDEHRVLLEGGVGLYVTGLLTFQVDNPGRLIEQLGQRDILQAVTQITKAEISRVFSTIHLEHISTAQMNQDTKEGGSVLGKQEQEGERGQICHEILLAIRPMATHWGIEMINFQIENLILSDRKYALEYEEASLAMAKAKSHRRALDLNNDIQIQKAKAQAEALRIEAEGQKVASIIESEGKAESERIEARGRHEAAETMTNEFAKRLAYTGQQVEFAASLNATTLSVIPDIDIEFTKDFGKKNN